MDAVGRADGRNRKNLMAAFRRVKENKGGAGVDHQTVEMFETRLEENLEKLSDSLREGRYQPQAIRRIYLPKPAGGKMRPIGIPTIRDRVVQGALRNVLDPIFEKDFAEGSYGFRPGRGGKDALRVYLAQKVMEPMKEWTPEEGTPQGAVISPLLSSNIHLDPLDHLMARKGFKMVRYSAGQIPSLPNMGCSHSLQPMRRSVNPLGGGPPTGEPYAGDPHLFRWLFKSMILEDFGGLSLIFKMG